MDDHRTHSEFAQSGSLYLGTVPATQLFNPMLRVAPEEPFAAFRDKTRLLVNVNTFLTKLILRYHHESSTLIVTKGLL